MKHNVSIMPPIEDGIASTALRIVTFFAQKMPADNCTNIATSKHQLSPITLHTTATSVHSSNATSAQHQHSPQCMDAIEQSAQHRRHPFAGH